MHDPDEARRRSARRTAWLVGGVALLVYLGALLKAFLAR